MTVTVFITGAANGLGKAIALRLAARKKYNLALTDIDSKNLENTVNECRSACPNIKVLKMLKLLLSFLTKKEKT